MRLEVTHLATGPNKHEQRVHRELVLLVNLHG